MTDKKIELRIHSQNQGGDGYKQVNAIDVGALVEDAKNFDNKHVMHTFTTEYGPLNVAVDGDLKDNVIVTYHDIGLNHITCFQRFCEHLRSQKGSVFDRFCFVHIDCPGQQENSSDLPDEIKELEMETLADQIKQVVDGLRIDRFYGMGAGAGGYILQLFAQRHPGYVAGMILFGSTCRKNGWIEWFRKFMGAYGTHITGNEEWWRDWFTERWLGETSRNENPDLVDYYFSELFRIPTNNLWKFVQGFQRRKDITKGLKKFRFPYFIIAGDGTPFVNEAIHMIDTLDDDQSEFFKLWGCGMLLGEEKPDSLVEPLTLWFKIQGIW